MKPLRLGPALLAIVAAAHGAGAATAHAQESIALPGRDTQITQTLDLLFEIGGVNAPEWAAFQSLDDAAIGPDGTIYLLDATSSRVVAVSADGTTGRQIGGNGEGPGEYRTPTGIAVREDGALVVFDATKRGFLPYATDGTPGEETRLDVTVGAPEGPFAVDGDGSVLSFPARIISGRLGHAYITGEGITPAGGSLPILRIPMTGNARVTVAANPSMPTRETDPPGTVIRVFEPFPSFAPVAGGGLAIADSEDYSITVYGRGGTDVLTMTRPFPSRPLTSADREAHQRSQEESGTARVRSLGDGPGGGSGRPPPAPGFYPVITPILAITGSGSGPIWVLRRDASDPTGAGPLDLIDPDGTYLGTLPAHPRGLPAAFGPDGLVVFFERGEYDVMIARVYQLSS